MGLLDYYRQFEDIDEEDLNRERRARRARERAMELEQVPTIDLSRTEWPDFPNSEVVNASIYAARGRINGYPDRYATEVRRLLAARHKIEPEQVVLGNGASELMQAAVQLLATAGDEVVMPWPSYPLFPLIVQRAGARPVAVELSGGRIDTGSVEQAVGDDTRVVIICNPNDPTGTYTESGALAELLGRLPENVHVLLDEAYIQFQNLEQEDACLRLIDAFPRLLVFRTFSKVYGLSGLRAGYVVGSPASAALLSSLSPVLGVSALTQAGVGQAIRIGDSEIERRRRLVIDQRSRLIDALHDLPVNAPPSAANFVWISTPGLSGAELTGRLERAGVIVAPGGPLGDDDHVRASIRSAAATDRLLAALEAATSRSG